MAQNPRDIMLGEGTYDNPYQVNLIWTDDGKYYTVNTNIPFTWEGPNIAKPTKDNSILIGSSGGTTVWADYTSIFPNDYGMIQ